MLPALPEALARGLRQALPPGAVLLVPGQPAVPLQRLLCMAGEEAEEAAGEAAQEEATEAANELCEVTDAPGSALLQRQGLVQHVPAMKDLENGGDG